MTKNVTFTRIAGNALPPAPPAQRPTGVPLQPATISARSIRATGSAQPTATRSRNRGPLSIVLIIVIVLASVVAGLLGGELYARKTAVDKVRAAAACQIEDSENTVTVSFSTSPPVLWQYVNDKYTGFTITTHGTHIRSVQGMTAEIVVGDIDMNGDANKKGTIGAINATITWTAEGMRESFNTALKEAIDEHLKHSVLSFLQTWISTDQVVTSVKTDPSAGTITLEGIFNSRVSVKPVVTSDGGIRLVIQPGSFKLGGNLNLPQDDLQKKLDEMTGKLTENKLNIRADSLEVLNDSVVGKFSVKNAVIPNGDGGGNGQTGGCEGL
jgi:hypothetical protein